ncbi:hypothetical protein [Rathayibacter toxicus]|uniref:hypothetical protein n=1 Tax=Rathayibacter toxicus TaxID=145458 RepID=UPI001C03B538|nr:hypothetical protein [Rathayibacter toxicus]QWL31166.1 hypothetical protein E2R34_10720 [Rathayibacter toxicus]
MPYLSDDERQQALRDLRKTAPESVDVEQLVAGELRAGVSENRPPVPVWEYREYAQQHPGTSLDELADIRFPVLLADDNVTVTSIAEFLSPSPVPSPLRLTINDVIEMYRREYEAGALVWDAEQLVHRCVSGHEKARRAALEA